MHADVKKGSSAGEIFISDFLSAISVSRWLIFWAVFFALMGGIAHAYLATPIYQSNALLQIERESVGIGALEDFSGYADLFESAALTTETELVQSRSVMKPVVNEFNLDIIAQPVYAPLFGRIFVSKFADANRLSDSLFGLEEYAWGGEKIVVEALDIPENYIGSQFTIKIAEANTFELYDNNDKFLGKFEVGKNNSVTTENGETIRLLISDLKGRVGTNFILIKIPELKAINQLISITTVQSIGESVVRSASGITGLLEISVLGDNPKQTAALNNQIVSSYIDYKRTLNAQKAEATYRELKEQLTRVKTNLEAIENAQIKYQKDKGSVNLEKETDFILQHIADVESEISKLEKERYALLRKFNPTHPQVAALDLQISAEKRKLKSYEGKINMLPDTQQEMIRLSRELKVNSDLYTTLLDKVQELDVVKAGTAGNANVIDYADVPFEPVLPKKHFIIGVYIIIGALLGLGIAVIRNILFGGVKDPDIIEKELGIPVYAMVPHSKIQKKLSRNQDEKKYFPTILAYKNPEDPAIESVRSLRTSMHFALLEAKNNIVAILSPGPNDGKSFICVNYGVVLANASKKVLVIDADLRKGCLHKTFGMKRENGLADLIAENNDVEAAIRKTQIENLYIITTGVLPPNPSELLLHDNFLTKLERLAQMFDYVIIDTPPVLAVTDSATISSMAGVTFLVVKNGAHSLGELDHCVKRLSQAKGNVRGILLNDIQAINKGVGQAKYYGYSYTYAPQKRN